MKGYEKETISTTTLVEHRVNVYNKQLMIELRVSLDKVPKGAIFMRSDQLSDVLTVLVFHERRVGSGNVI